MCAIAVSGTFNHKFNPVWALYDRGASPSFDQIKAALEHNNMLHTMCENCVALRDVLNKHLFDCVIQEMTEDNEP